MEQILFMIAGVVGERCSQLPYLHTADLCLHSELTDRSFLDRAVHEL
jgi:hypothetical protein